MMRHFLVLSTAFVLLVSVCQDLQASLLQRETTQGQSNEAPLENEELGAVEPLQGLRVLFEGNTDISSSRLRKAISKELEDFVTHQRKAFADDAAFELASQYLASGYPDATVGFEISPSDRLAAPMDHDQPSAEKASTPATLRFLIQEGPRTVVEAVNFLGNESYENKSLLAFFESARRSALGARSDFVLSRVQAEAGTLQNFYRAAGFLEAKVEPPRVDFTEDRRAAVLHIQIHEGPRFFLRKIQIPTIAAVPQREQDEIHGRFLNQPYNSRFPFEIRGLLTDSLGRRGFPDAKVEVQVEMESETERALQKARAKNLPSETSPDSPPPTNSGNQKDSEAALESDDQEGQVSIAFQITLGPHVTLSEIRIEGAKKSREGFIRSCVDFKAGQPFDNKRVRESFRCLYRTGLFQRVDIGLEDSVETQRPLIVTVEEFPTREIFLEPGFGSYEGLRLKLGLKQKNLFGKGSELRGDTTIAQQALRGTLTYSDPWALLDGITTDISLSTNERELDGFTSTKYGAGISFRKEWSNRLTGTLGYQFRRSESRDVIDPLALEVSQEDVDISSLKLSGRYDDRDNLFAPRKGWLTELHLEYATASLGSQLEFFRTRLTTSAFHPLSEKTTLGISLRGGMITPIGGDTEIPLQERYYSGGENSVRSFKENTLLPRDRDGNPVADDQGNSQGGEAFATISLELRQALLGNLHGAIFADAGSLSGTSSDLFDFQELETAVGLGLRYLLPIGPVRLDGAWNPDRQDGEDGFVLHFSVGMAF